MTTRAGGYGLDMTIDLDDARTIECPQRAEGWALAAGFVLLPVIAGAAVGQLVETGPWYDEIDKAPLHPPSWVFAPVWTVLYLMIGLAGYLAMAATPSRDRVAVITPWVVQLVLNLAWTPIFFGLERPGWALVDIIALVVMLAATIVVFHRRSTLAAWLLVPYLGWVLFATYLTLGVVVLN